MSDEKPIRGRWVWTKDRGLVAKAEYRPPRLHYVQQDTRDPFVSHVNGKTFDSMSAYKRHLKQEGYEIKGGERLPPVPGSDLKANSEDIRADTERAAQLIKWGMAPSTSEERELWEQENRKIRK